jgi:hypothetical protein
MQDKNDRLLRNLVSEPGDKSSQPGKVSFIAAMQQMGMTSVFDIIGQSKPQFVERLGEICDADGALAYDNAMCYAVQIGGLYREYRVSSGKPQDLTQRTGVRALVDVGPSYPNLFKENWDEFCKVGAIAAVDSPVAYLRFLYNFATRTLETSGQGDRPKILLGKRRPDIARLIIDQQSTFTPRPMLELVNGILKEDIQRYHQGKPDENKPVYELLAERRYPFIFPYNFAHHQCRLGLAEKKLGLGVLNYLISREVPATQADSNVYGVVQNGSLEAQRLLSGLSPQQQQLLIEPSLFTTFYLSKAELAAGWRGPGTSHLRPHKALGVGFLLLPGQVSIEVVVPVADFLINNYSYTNQAAIFFSKADSPDKLHEIVSFNSGTPARSDLWSLNYLHQASSETMCPYIKWGGNDSAGYRASFTLTTTSGSVTAPTGVAALSVTLMSDEIPVWSVEQKGFFQKHYGLEKSSSVQLDQSLIDLNTFMQRTGLDAQQVEAVLSQRTHFPRLSPNCPSTNPQFGATGIGTPYPHASHFGACYVNGHGSGRYDSVMPATATSIRKDRFDNSMGLKELLVGGRKTWHLTKTSPNRFDRLQRMIRLQRWLDIPFAELDTLIISAIRSEGEHNLTMDLNLNTLRALGVYRYLAQRYKLEPLEFAAFLHDLTPYATGDDVPLFDQVFNEVALFDVPLVLDQQAFNATGTDVASKRTVAQLCAGLGLQPTALSFLRLAGQTQQHVGPLKRDLETVSSIYRQARIPQMFGLSAEDGWALVDLLGGQDYQQLLCTGRLSPQSGQSLKPVYIKAGDSSLEITLALIADPLATGDSLRLLAGSMLFVEKGRDFIVGEGDRREFTLDREPQFSKVGWFLTNADGSQLTLDPVEAGESLSLSGKNITRAGWEAISDWPAKPIKYLRVRCYDLPARLLTFKGVTKGEALPTPPDILDLLMQMDWAVTWLKDSKQDVAEVRRLLGLDPGDYLPPQGLIDRLAKLADDTRAAVITDQQIEALDLPTHEAPAKGRAPGDAINWRTILLPLLDQRGLVKALPLELFENTQGQLSAALELALKPLRLEPEARARSLEKLGKLLLAGHDRQLRLIEGLTQEMVNLPMDRTQVVVRWAGTSVYELLSAVLQTDADISPTAWLLEQIRSLLRHAQAALHVRLGTSALRLFLVHPEWLGGKGGTALSWASFYLLGRYSQWLGSQGQAEEALLGYFIAANPAKARLKNKALRSVVNDEAAEALANLLGWSVQEVSRLFQELPQGRACSMAEVDWIWRCQGASKASGMTAADVLAATALHADSAPAAWQAVGEAAVAASR